MRNAQAQMKEGWKRNRVSECLRIVLASLVIFVAACSRAETPKVTPVTVKLRVAADTAALPLMQALTDAYSTAHPEIIFTIQSGNAQASADRVFAGEADIAAVSLLPPKVEGRATPWMADLAMDGVAVIVNPANPIDSLTMQDLRDIYAGVHNRWSDYGVVGLEDIQVAVREEGDGARATFDSLVMDNTPLTLSAVVMPTVDVAMNFTSLEATAIAYVPTGRITSTVTPGVRVIGIDGQLPTPANIASGSYPLTRMLNLIAPGEPEGDLRLFVAWALGDEGQRITKDLNYVPAAQAPR
jgi:phosphate transport system substrate-binding protein